MIALPRLAGRIFGVPVAIERGKLDVIVAAVAPRLLGMGSLTVMDDDDEEDAAPARRQLPYIVTPDGIAVIDIEGTLVSKSAGMSAMSGLTTYSEIARNFAGAMNDPAVRGIVLNIDSPGGEVSGMFDLADAMALSRGQKPIVAAATFACSAAYLLASTAGAVMVARDGNVGSIGVLMLHLDSSGADQQAGLKYTAIYAGGRKNDGNPHEPLTDPARARMQSNVNTIYGLFTSAVAKNRRMTVDAVRNTQALSYMGMDGVSAGLADMVGNTSAAVALVREAVKGNKKSILAARAAIPGGNRMPDEITAAQPQQTTAAAPAQPVATPPAAQPVSVAPATTIHVHAMSAEEIREAMVAEVSAVTDMCALAGHPELATGFLTARTNPNEVRKQLLALKVKENGGLVNSSVMPGTDAPEAAPNAVEKRFGKPKPWKEVIAAMSGRKENR